MSIGDLLRCVALLSLLGSTFALFGLDALGGTYRYGHIFWTGDGNSVDVTIETSFRRNVQTSYFQGTAPDGLAQVGDIITLTGRETPKVYFGDASIMDVLRMTVTAYSVSEDWILGTVHLTHMYSSPNNAGQPWLIQYMGCCRVSNLQNNKDAQWVLTADVDLSRSLSSPRVTMLPIVTVPFKTADYPNSNPTISIPATSPNNEVAMEWSIAKPYEVGNAALFRAEQQSTVTVGMNPGTANTSIGFSHPDMLTDWCKDVGEDKSISPGCMFRLLRSDNRLPGFTVEGWVKIINDEGGVVLSTGLDESAGRPAECIGNLDNARKGMCQAAMIYIKANATHITAGHEMYDGTKWVLLTQAFEICSSVDLCAQLSDRTKYAAPSSSGPDKKITNKWVHVAVVRRSKLSYTQVNGFAAWSSSYQVYVNGFLLEVVKYPACSPADPASTGTQTVQCRGQSFSFYNKGTMFALGESNPIPGPRRTGQADFETESLGRCYSAPAADPPTQCTDAFGTHTALLFGAFKGASSNATYFSGYLDEFRFWNGVRSGSQILTGLQTILNPSGEASYGDPTTVKDIAGISVPVSADNFQDTSVLMCVYNFDAVTFGLYLASDVDPSCPYTSTGCPMGGLMPIYPKPADPRLPPTSLFARAMMVGNTVSVLNALTDTTGVMFFSQVGQMRIDQTGLLTLDGIPNPGLFQVSVLVSLQNNASRVPVDFLVNVVNGRGLDLCNIPEITTPCPYPNNKYMPSLEVWGSVVRTGIYDGKYMGNATAPVDLTEFLYPATITTFDGFEFSLTLKGADSQKATVLLEGCTDPATCVDWRDTNVGFTMGPQPKFAHYSTVTGTNPSHQSLYWTPCPEDVGYKTMCWDAVDRHILDRTTGATAQTMSSDMKCVKVEVLADPPPVFDTELSTMGPVTLTMGRETVLEVFVEDANCLDVVTVGVEGGDMLRGAVLHPQMSYDSRNGLSCTSQRRRIVWTPAYDMGGFSQEVCFTAQDSTGACAGASPTIVKHCILVNVQRCKYALGMDEQLQELAGRLEVDWIRLWSLNQALRHPDYIVYSRQEVWIGHRYQVMSGERADGVAKRMGMSMDQMKRLNHDLDMEGILETGQMICVIPNSCTGMRQTVYSSLTYRDEKFFATHAGDQSTNPQPTVQPTP